MPVIDHATCGLARAAGPVLGEREKERLATLMRFRGKPPTITPEDMALLNRKAAAANRNKGEREQLEELFDAVLQVRCGGGRPQGGRQALAQCCSSSRYRNGQRRVPAACTAPRTCRPCAPRQAHAHWWL